MRKGEKRVIWISDFFIVSKSIIFNTFWKSNEWWLIGLASDCGNNNVIHSCTVNIRLKDELSLQSLEKNNVEHLIFDCASRWRDSLTNAIIIYNFKKKEVWCECICSRLKQLGLFTGTNALSVEFQWT